MFEVYKRHRPVFAVSEVKRIARLLHESLGFGDPELTRSGVEIVDIAQTARINEANQFILKSALPDEQVLAALKKSSALCSLGGDDAGSARIRDRILGEMIKSYGIDSCLRFGDASVPMPASGLPPATAGSRTPLLLFTAHSGIDWAALDPRWLDADHPAIWLGRDWVPAMEGTEAFFAISPDLKREVALNRYQPLASFGDFAVGMVRL